MAACSFVIGIYDGFYGPGTGTFLLLAFTKLGKLDMEKATGNVKVVNLTSNISALITFILAGKILWVLDFRRRYSALPDIILAHIWL